MAIQQRGSSAGPRWDPWAEFGDFERAMNRVFGVLQVVLPKSKEAQPHKITVKPG